MRRGGPSDDLPPRRVSAPAQVPTRRRARRDTLSCRRRRCRSGRWCGDAGSAAITIDGGDEELGDGDAREDRRTSRCSSAPNARASSVRSPRQILRALARRAAPARQRSFGGHKPRSSKPRIQQALRHVADPRAALAETLSTAPRAGRQALSPDRSIGNPSLPGSRCFRNGCIDSGTASLGR